MKVFISQPMRGRSDEEIKAERKEAMQRVASCFPFEGVEEIDSFFENAPADARPLWYLGESLKLLATADVAVFCPGWSTMRGCKIEHQACVDYGVDIVELWPQDNPGDPDEYLHREM